MSASPTLVTAEHFAYLADRTEGDDAFLQDLKRAAAEAGIPAIWISPAQASFMRILLRVAGARHVVEVGTLAGYSAIAMARALPEDGCLKTIELEAAHADFADDWIGRSDVAGRIEVLRGAGSDILPDLPDGWGDALFLDADKAGYAAYLEQGLRILRPGGLILVDNAFAFGQLLDASPSDGEVGAVRAFNDHMAAQARAGRLDGVIIPIGDGLWVGVKR